MNAERSKPHMLLPALLLLAFPSASGTAAQQSGAGCTGGGCHAEIAASSPAHEAAPGWDCIMCHVPQAGDTPPHHRGKVGGVLSEPRDGETCISCHAKGFGFLRHRDPVEAEEVAADATPRIVAHGPVQEARCSPCHLAHGPPQSRFLRGELPVGLYAQYQRPAYTACYQSCHDPALVEEDRTETATGFRNGDDNLHYRHVSSRRLDHTCGLCHEPHRAPNAALIKSSIPFGVERLTLEFEATDSGGSCTTSCHIPAEYDRAKAIPSRMRVRDSLRGKENQ